MGFRVKERIRVRVRMMVKVRVKMQLKHVCWRQVHVKTRVW